MWNGEFVMISEETRTEGGQNRQIENAGRWKRVGWKWTTRKRREKTTRTIGEKLEEIEIVVKDRELLNFSKWIWNKKKKKRGKS